MLSISIIIFNTIHVKQMSVLRLYTKVMNLTDIEGFKVYFACDTQFYTKLLIIRSL